MGGTFEAPSARWILALKGDGSGTVQRAEPLFQPETLGPLRWKQEGAKLILTEADGGRITLTVLEKTASTMKVLQPASAIDGTAGAMRIYTRTGDEN
jgi:hypothetical protein